jgi:hypothetical protein
MAMALDELRPPGLATMIGKKLGLNLTAVCKVPVCDRRDSFHITFFLLT